MGRIARLALTAAALGAGAAAGYVVERRALRQRLDVPPGAGAELGSLEGAISHVPGPRGTQLTVETYGPEDAPQIVLAHGWVCTGRIWHEQVAGLADRFRLITFDQPGHGRTTRPFDECYDMDLFGDALQAVIEHTATPGPLILVGHSLGGMAILNAVRRYPQLDPRRVGGIVLLSTASTAAADDLRFGFGVHSLARFERAIGRVVGLVKPEARYVADRFYRASTDLSFLLTRTFGLARGADPRYVDFTEQLLLDSDFDMITGVLAPILTLDEDESLTCVRVPTLVICGSDDRITPIGMSRRMVDRCPHAEMLELEGVGHMTPLEAHPAVNAAVSELVARVVEAVA